MSVLWIWVLAWVQDSLYDYKSTSVVQIYSIQVINEYSRNRQSEGSKHTSQVALQYVNEPLRIHVGGVCNTTCLAP